LSADSAGLSDGTIDLPQALRVQTNGGSGSPSLRIEVRAPRLALDTLNLDFGVVALGETRERPLVIRNEGTAVLEATVQPRVPWLSLPQSRITCEPGEQAVLQVRADTSSLIRGQEVVLNSAAEISWDGGIEEVPARLLVLQPALRVDPPAVDFGYIDALRPARRTLAIVNEGTGDLAWNAQTDATWLEISPRSGRCEAGERRNLELTAYGLALDLGVQAANGTLIVNSDGGRAKVPLRVALASPLLAIDTTFLDLGTSVNGEDVAGSFRIFNHGLGVLRGTIQSNQTWLVVDRASFDCEMGHSVEVRVSTDMEEMPPGTTGARGLILAASNGGDAQIEVRVRMVLVARLEPAKKVIRLNRHEAGQPPQGRISIKNVGLATARTELRTGLPELVLTRSRCDIKPGKSARIVVQWQGASKPDPHGLYVDIIYDDQEIRVPARFEVETLENRPRM